MKKRTPKPPVFARTRTRAVNSVNFGFPKGKALTIYVEPDTKDEVIKEKFRRLLGDTNAVNHFRRGDHV